ncbi:MAG: type II toxin-antitoxin system VapB family antitoxin [Actinobacteria bacterium]|nr:MAG: type II toxin-antitoxin system VapB family antitoxin [Actinomycetota bacterium]
MTRTTVDIDDELLACVMRRYGLASKRAAVDLALRSLAIEPLTREQALAMRGSGWEGDLGHLRRGGATQSTPSPPPT